MLETQLNAFNTFPVGAAYKGEFRVGKAGDKPTRLSQKSAKFRMLSAVSGGCVFFLRWA